jgi:dTDP-glucose 4,6-dehydratase
MRLLVTGGCGFIGANFVRWQRQHHPEDQLVVLDALTYAGNLHNLDGLGVTVWAPTGAATAPASLAVAAGGHPEAKAKADGVVFVRGDICDAVLVDALFGEFAIDAVVHFAAESHVDRSILGPAAFVRTNVMGTATLLERARAAQVSRFLQVSTDEVYGDLGPTDPPFCETTPLGPRSPYSASKAAADHLVQAYFHTYHFPTLITRCSNNYGPYQFPEKLVPLMVLNALADQPLPVYGDGMNVRDWLHVEDHCAALDLVLRRGREGEVYNVGGDNERHNIEIVRQVLALLGKPESLIRFVTDRPGHDRRYAIDARKLQGTLGWVPRWRFAEGLAATVAWYRSNEAWWRAIRSGEYQSWYERNYGARETLVAQTAAAATTVVAGSRASS